MAQAKPDPVATMAGELTTALADAASVSPSVGTGASAEADDGRQHPPPPASEQPASPERLREQPSAWASTASMPPGASTSSVTGPLVIDASGATLLIRTPFASTSDPFDLRTYKERWIKSARTILKDDDVPPFDVLSLAAESALSEEDSAQLLQDVHRSEVSDLRISDEARKLHDTKLHNMLRAWCVYRPELGYVQGMNFIGSVCLAVAGHDEGDALVIFAAIVARLPDDFFDETLSGFQVEVAALLLLLQDRTSLADDEAEATMMRQSLPAVATQWLITMWVGTMPLACVLRIWDMLLATDERADQAAAGATLGVSLALMQLSKEAISEAQAKAVASGGDPTEVFLALARLHEHEDITRDVGLRLFSLLDTQPLIPSVAKKLRAVARRRCENDGTLKPRASTSGGTPAKGPRCQQEFLSRARRVEQPASSVEGMRANRANRVLQAARNTAVGVGAGAAALPLAFLDALL